MNKSQIAWEYLTPLQQAQLIWLYPELGWKDDKEGKDNGQQTD